MHSATTQNPAAARNRAVPRTAQGPAARCPAAIPAGPRRAAPPDERRPAAGRTEPSL